MRTFPSVSSHQLLSMRARLLSIDNTPFAMLYFSLTTHTLLPDQNEALSPKVKTSYAVASCPRRISLCCRSVLAARRDHKMHKCVAKPHPSDGWASFLRLIVWPIVRVMRGARRQTMVLSCL